MDINYEHYKVFYLVASSLSFSEASRKLFISQSAVSQSIKTLERKLEQAMKAYGIMLTQKGVASTFDSICTEAHVIMEY